MASCVCVQGVLQRSNYAAWGVELASQISATAGWSKQASQELSKGEPLLRMARNGKHYTLSQ